MVKLRPGKYDLNSNPYEHYCHPLNSEAANDVVNICTYTGKFLKDGKPVIVKTYTEDGGMIGPPYGLYLQNKSFYVRSFEDGNESTICKNPLLEKSNITLGGSPQWDWQIYEVPIIAEILDSLKGGVILQAGCGTGKTRAAIAVAAKMGYPTLVIVDRSFIMNQWKYNIANLLDIPLDNIGIVHRNTCDYKDKPITIAMAQSLISRDYGEAFYNAFGFMVVDEVHSFAAPLMNTSITPFRTLRRLGLSATPNRPDGLSGVFEDHIGRTYIKVGAPRAKPLVVMVKLPDYLENLSYQPSPPMAVNLLTGSGVPSKKAAKELGLGKTAAKKAVAKPNGTSIRRDAIIVQELVKAALNNRKILVMSDRIPNLNQLKTAMDNCGDWMQDFFIGGRKQEDLDQAEMAQIVYTTYSMAAKAMDIPALDTLFLVSPRSDVEQAVGRILRQDDDKKSPIVVDFADPYFSNKSSKRYCWYQSQGYDIKVMER